MSRIVALALLMSLVASPAAAQLPELAVGQRVRIGAPTLAPDRLEGRVISITSDSLVLEAHDGGEWIIRAGHVASVERSRGRSRLAGAARGAMIGAGAALPIVILAVTDDGGCDDATFATVGCDDGFRAIVAGSALVLGTGVGAVLGAAVGRERWERVSAAPARVIVAAGGSGVRVGLRVLTTAR